MTLLFEAVFVVCTLAPLNHWIGDKDTGPTCVEIERIAFPTDRQCLTRLEDTLKVLSTKEEQAHIPVAKPYEFYAECRIKFAEGPLPCRNCRDTELAQAPTYCTFCKE